MADATYQPKVYRTSGGDKQVIASGGTLEIESGGTLIVPTNTGPVRGGIGTLDGTNPTPVVTGLSSITSFTATLDGTAAPGDNTSVLTTTVGASGTATVYAWKNTSGTDPTLVASTGTETFSWIAFGA